MFNKFHAYQNSLLDFVFLIKKILKYFIKIYVLLDLLYWYTIRMTSLRAFYIRIRQFNPEALDLDSDKACWYLVRYPDSQVAGK